MLRSSKDIDSIHRTIFAKTDMAVDQALVRSIAPNVAIAVAMMKFGPVTIPSGQVIPELRTCGSFTMRLRKMENGRLPHFQNTSIDVEAEKNDPITWDDTGFLPGRKWSCAHWTPTWKKIHEINHSPGDCTALQRGPRRLAANSENLG
jgi:hypothetical protein